MREPSWKRLVEELRQSGHQSPYLERLKDRLPTGGPMRDLAREILREMASSLGRAEDKVNASLLRIELHAREIETLLAAPERDDDWRRAVNARIHEHNRERDVALGCLWELRVHREALGFRQNHDLGEHYPIPPKREPIR